MKSASHTSVIAALKFVVLLCLSAINKIVLYFGQCITICGPEFQRTSVIAYSYFCLLYKCFSFVRRTLLCWHHCLKFRGNDRLNSFRLFLHRVSSNHCLYHCQSMDPMYPSSRSREPVGEVKIKLCASLASQRIHYKS